MQNLPPTITTITQIDAIANHIRHLRFYDHKFDYETVASTVRKIERLHELQIPAQVWNE
ncbi:hypothetical protein BGX23_011779, partial [Mortierella sp. AD031]